VTAAALALLLGTGAQAQEPPPEEEPFDLPPVSLERLPPRRSFEAGVRVTYGDYAIADGETWPWMGFGVRTAGGAHLGTSRFGAALDLGIEGEAPLLFNFVIEPQATWDRVSGGLQLGASIGPSILVHAAMGLQDLEYAPAFAPSAALRLGWSQPWTRIGRRMFVLVEPRVRLVHGELHPTVGVVVGSGWGR
jgi:hypothetical protein